MSELAVILVTHEARDRVLASLDDLAADPAHADWETVVVDNASTDGTIEAIAARHPAVRTIRNAVGRGFAAAVNQGIASTEAPAVAIATAGTRVPVGALGRLAEVLGSARNVAAVGPLIHNPDGTVQRHGLFRPRAITALIVLLGLDRLPGLGREAERYYGPHLPGPPLEVEQLSGACVVLSRAAIEAIGTFDERFFLYCEDVDWCLRAKSAGWRVVFAPDVAVSREKAATAKGSSGPTIRLYYRSLRWFYAKHHASTPVPIRMVWSAGAYLTEWFALGSNSVRRRKGLRY